nr:MAG TPA: hypothetical protein [Caudoviricetes sp.]
MYYIFINLLIAVMANVISHYVCKWLDSFLSDN